MAARTARPRVTAVMPLRLPEPLTTAELEQQLGEGGLDVVLEKIVAGGALKMHITVPVHDRYVINWFTKLPPDAAGTYQASVYKINVRGQR